MPSRGGKHPLHGCRRHLLRQEHAGGAAAKVERPPLEPARFKQAVPSGRRGEDRSASPFGHEDDVALLPKLGGSHPNGSGSDPGSARSSAWWLLQRSKLAKPMQEQEKPVTRGVLAPVAREATDRLLVDPDGMLERPVGQRQMSCVPVVFTAVIRTVIAAPKQALDTRTPAAPAGPCRGPQSWRAKAAACRRRCGAEVRS